MEKKKQSLREVYVNNIYAVRLTASASKSRVIHSFFGKLIGNLEWVFFSGFFMRYIVNQLEQGKEFSEIFAFILICGAVFFLLAIHRGYVEMLQFRSRNLQSMEKFMRRFMKRPGMWN